MSRSSRRRRLVLDLVGAVALWLAANVVDLALGLVLIIAWLAVTLGIARIAAARVVWPVSIGLLLFSGIGWRVVLRVALDGLYDLGASSDSSPRRDR